jgi:muconolactone delta-isomerase
MEFLVRGTFVEAGPLLTPEGLVQLIDQSILPSVEMLAQWQEEGRIRGGVLAGQREGSFVMEADSAEELGQLLSSLPFWGLIKWDVAPLQSFRSTYDREREVRDRVQGALGQAGS